MKIIEFLQASGQKNIKSYIGMKVKEKVLEYEKALQERQQILRNILEFENMQYNDELVQLMNENINEQFRTRLDWVNTRYMDNVKAKEELLKLKNHQRVLENCEEWRHFQSKQLLLDSKIGQLRQIEDKKIRMQREKEIDEMWDEVMTRLNYEKDQEEIYGNMILKVIEKANQYKNQESNDNRKQQQELEYQQDIKEYQEDYQKGLLMQEKYRKDEKFREFLKATHHKCNIIGISV